MKKIALIILILNVFVSGFTVAQQVEHLIALCILLRNQKLLLN